MINKYFTRLFILNNVTKYIADHGSKVFPGLFVFPAYDIDILKNADS